METVSTGHRPQNLGLWIEADESSRYGVAIFNFRENGAHRLPLDIGDTVNIICHTEDWYYGFKTKNHGRKGIFPKKFVCIRDSVVDSSGPYDVILPVEPPIVHEITAVLREWGRIWMDLYMHSKRAQKTNFNQIHKTMLELIDYRRLIMSRKLPLDEMKEYQQKVTNKIDMGNARLGLDLVVRDERGNIVDPLKNSTVNLYRLHQVATKRIEEERGLIQDRHVPKKVSCFNLYVNVKNFVCRIGEHADILLTLYDAKDGLFISDNYIMKWGNHGMPKDIDMLNNLRVIFTDLSLKDSSREKVFLVCQIIRIGRMDLKEADSKKQAKGMRRPFGVAAVEVTEILNGKSDSDGEKQFFIPFLQCGERDFMENIIKKAITARDINHKGQGLWVTMCILHGDLAQIQKDYPHIVTSTTAVARKMGFPDVILPGDVRNDLYVTLMQGEFRKGGKVADKNVEVTLTVCNEDGEVIENVISEGAGGDMITQYKSIIYYHEDKPRWFETVKLAIPINQFYGSHLKFTFKHRSTSEAKDRSERNFAMCYIRLMNDDGTTLGDTTHYLLMYRIDPKKSEDTSRTYFSLPSTAREMRPSSSVGSPKSSLGVGGLSFNPADTFQISTLVCSTKLTHNVDLMGLLKWRDNLSTLTRHLRTFMSVDGEEIVKFLQDVLDALFNILMENADSKTFDNLVFEALIFLFGIISDHKYRQFRPVLDLYIRETFSATLAYTKLVIVLKSYIDDVSSASKIESLHKIMKSLEYIFKFIVRSRDLFAALNENKEKLEFEQLLHQLFNSINNLVRNANDATLSVCETVMKNLPSVITDIITVCNPLEFSGVLVEFLKSIPTDRLAKQKMHYINDLVHSPLFLISDCRRILFPVLLMHVESLLSNHEELEICIRILSDIMDLLYNAERVGDTYEDIKTISLSMLRVIIQTVIFMMENGIKLVDNAVAVLTSILRQMTERHYENYILQFETTIDLNDFLMEILMVIEDLVRRNVYPADWNEMIMLQNWVFLKALKYFSSIIQSKFKNPFAFEIWRRIFFSAIAFLTQAPLQLELFSEVKRSKILSRYKDMRREGGFEIRSMWFNLGQHKIEFIPEIVGLILEMTLIPEPELRRHTIPIFFDMMQCEFMSLKPNSKHHVRNFNMFEQEVIAKLDELVGANRGDKEYQELFFDVIKEKCEQHSTMRDMGLKFVDTIKQLMQLLLEYRGVIKEDNLDNKMSCTVSLLNFYHDISRRELYLQYLHKLCQLHLEAENYTEAAFTLMIYAKHLQWTNNPILPYLMSSKYPEETLHRNLKERIYYDIISYFDQGKMWEKGIEVCKELSVQYETQIFDYLRLSMILRKQAELYDSIMTKVRPEPEYFRVGYYGAGFPSFLQNRVYIYRGKEYERLSDFTARLQNQFPNAQLLKTLNQPTDDIKQQPNQYLQINKVTPMLELKNHLTGKQLNDQILKFYKVNDVQKFTYSRKKDESTTDAASMWLERTNLVTSFPFPGILRWFPVTSTHTFDVSPLELAIEVIDETNDKIRSLIDQHLGDPNLKADPLGMVLHGVVDAAVNGGIANYKVFYTDEYLKSRDNEAERDQITRLRQGTKHQLLLLKKALDIHRERAPESLQPFQAHLEQRYCQMKNVLETEYGIKVTDEEYLSQGPDLIPLNSVKRVHSMPAPRHIQSNSRNIIGASTPNIAVVTAAPSILPSVAEAKSIMRAFSSFNVGSLGNDNVPARSSPQRKSSSSQRDSVISGNSTSSLVRADTKDGSVVELSQELTPMRPLRPESEIKGRAGSQVKPMRTVTMTPLASPLESPSRDATKGGSVVTRSFEEPPPLPEKSNQADYANLATSDESPLPVGSCFVRQGTHKDRPHIPEPTLAQQQTASKKVTQNSEATLATPLSREDENLF